MSSESLTEILAEMRARVHGNRTLHRYLDRLSAALERASVPVAPSGYLTDDDCDRIAAQVIDKIAASHGLHGLELNTDIRHHNTLRRALIRAAYAFNKVNP